MCVGLSPSISGHQLNHPQLSRRNTCQQTDSSQRDVGVEEVEVAADEDQGIQLLCLQRYSCSRQLQAMRWAGLGDGLQYSVINQRPHLCRIWWP